MREVVPDNKYYTRYPEFFQYLLRIYLFFFPSPPTFLKTLPQPTRVSDLKAMANFSLIKTWTSAVLSTFTDYDKISRIAEAPTPTHEVRSMLRDFAQQQRRALEIVRNVLLTYRKLLS